MKKVARKDMPEYFFSIEQFTPATAQQEYNAMSEKHIKFLCLAGGAALALSFNASIASILNPLLTPLKLTYV